jgi:ABC-type sulfate/molybdate transport systems ATPase subunit
MSTKIDGYKTLLTHLTIAQNVQFGVNYRRHAGVVAGKKKGGKASEIGGEEEKE